MIPQKIILEIELRPLPLLRELCSASKGKQQRSTFPPTPTPPLLFLGPNVQHPHPRGRGIVSGERGIGRGFVVEGRCGREGDRARAQGVQRWLGYDPAARGRQPSHRGRQVGCRLMEWFVVVQHGDMITFVRTALRPAVVLVTQVLQLRIVLFWALYCRVFWI